MYSFIERVNLTIRRGVAPLMRKTWALAQSPDHLRLHMEWWRAYYHFVRPHDSLQLRYPVWQDAASCVRRPWLQASATGSGRWVRFSKSRSIRSSSANSSLLVTSSSGVIPFAEELNTGEFCPLTGSGCLFWWLAGASHSPVAGFGEAAELSVVSLCRTE